MIEEKVGLSRDNGEKIVGMFKDFIAVDEVSVGAPR